MSERSKACGCVYLVPNHDVPAVYPICDQPMTQEDLLCDKCRISQNCIAEREEQKELKAQGVTLEVWTTEQWLTHCDKVAYAKAQQRRRSFVTFDPGVELYTAPPGTLPITNV